jgi:hypothetical protein
MWLLLPAKKDGCLLFLGRVDLTFFERAIEAI